MPVWETQEMWTWSLGLWDPLEEEMANHSSILALETPWTEEPGGLQSMRLQRMGHDWATEHICKPNSKEKINIIRLQFKNYISIIHLILTILYLYLFYEWKNGDFRE